MVDRRSMRDVAVALAACAGVLLLADLGLGWHSVVINAEVGVANPVLVTVSATGWTNVGLFAGFVTIATLVALARSMRTGVVVDLPQAAVAAALGLACLGFTIGAALAATNFVTVAGSAQEIATRQWPAYAGIVLAAVLALGTLVALREVSRGTTVAAEV